MKNRKSLVLLARYLRAIGILTVINLSLSALICLIGGLTNWLDYSNILMYFSALFLALGALTLLGNKDLKGRSENQYVRTVRVENIDRSSSDSTKHHDKSFRFLIIMGAAGAISIIISIFVGKIGG